ncbi:MAG: rod-binding protein [Pseudomonadota bacterium]
MDPKTVKTSTEGKTADSAQETKLKKACADFEALLTYNLLKTMRRTIPSGGVIPRSSSRDTYEMMLDQYVAEAVARKGQGIGLQKAIYKQLAKTSQKDDSSSSDHASINVINKPSEE